jgi:glycosyltransferase involved in cell wall biosynthesis
VVPIYNEQETLDPCLERVVSVELPDAIGIALWLVDDHSEPDVFRHAEEVADRLAAQGHRIDLTRHEMNQGKGAALQTGFDRILASEAPDDDLVIVQDADLEYDPDDYATLIEPVRCGRADLVIGSRWGEQYERRGLKYRVHELGNRSLTWLSNAMTGLAVNDMECCYKVVPITVLRRLRPMLTERRFGIEPQIVASAARLGLRVAEVPVRYAPRGMAAGKKIGWRDGLRALQVIARERLRGDVATDGGG